MRFNLSNIESISICPTYISGCTGGVKNIIAGDKNQDFILTRIMDHCHRIGLLTNVLQGQVMI